MNSSSVKLKRCLQFFLEGLVKMPRNPFIHLMRWHKPIGFFLLLWPTLWALWIASNGHPDPKIAMIFILGTWIMRSAGCVINDFADRKLDPFVSRTAIRPLATGVVSAKQALALFAFLCLLALILVLQLNRLAIELSFVGLALAVIYPFTKRFIYFPQVFLGAAFAWGIPMVFAAIQNKIPAEAWLLFLAAFLWPLAYDTFYAMADREEDKKIGVKSLAICLGRYDRFFIALIQTLVLALLALLGALKHFSGVYYIALLLAGILMIYQLYLTRRSDPSKCLSAFKNNHWIGLIVFLGIVLSI